MAPNLELKLLWHRGRPRPETGSGRRTAQTLADVELVGDWPSGWRGELRWREKHESTWSWSERFPWQAARLQGVGSRRALSLKATWVHPDWRTAFSWRRLSRTKTERDIEAVGGAARHLVMVTGRRNLSANWDLRGAWSMGWGGPEDLVAALVPLAGYVVPRHWGHYTAERMLGARWRRGGLDLALAVAWRQATLGEAEDSWSVWTEGSWTW